MSDNITRFDDSMIVMCVPDALFFITNFLIEQFHFNMIIVFNGFSFLFKKKKKTKSGPILLINYRFLRSFFHTFILECVAYIGCYGLARLSCANATQQILRNSIRFCFFFCITFIWFLVIDTCVIPFICIWMKLSRYSE